jgi:hypothetical protein
MKEIFPDPDPTCSSIGYMSLYYLSKAYITNKAHHKQGTINKNIAVSTTCI